jgi:hypothetical protein
MLIMAGCMIFILVILWILGLVTTLEGSDRGDGGLIGVVVLVLIGATTCIVGMVLIMQRLV